MVQVRDVGQDAIDFLSVALFLRFVLLRFACLGNFKVRSPRVRLMRLLGLVQHIVRVLTLHLLYVEETLSNTLIYFSLNRFIIDTKVTLQSILGRMKT